MLRWRSRRSADASLRWRDLTPLDRAADRRMLHDRAVTQRRDHLHRVEQFAWRILGCRLASRRVEPAAVLKFELTVEAKKIRRADGVECARDLLRFVEEIGKRKNLFARQALH